MIQTGDYVSGYRNGHRYRGRAEVLARRSGCPQRVRIEDVDTGGALAVLYADEVHVLRKRKTMKMVHWLTLEADERRTISGDGGVSITAAPDGTIALHLRSDYAVGPELLEKLVYLIRFPLAMQNRDFMQECKNLVTKAEGREWPI